MGLATEKMERKQKSGAQMRQGKEAIFVNLGVCSSVLIFSESLAGLLE